MGYIAVLSFPVWVLSSHLEVEQSDEDRAKIGMFVIIWVSSICLLPLAEENDGTMNVILIVLLSLYDVILPYHKGYHGLTIAVNPTTFEELPEKEEEEEEEEDTTPRQCCGVLTAPRQVIAGLVIFVVFHNFTKVPFFLFQNAATNTTAGTPTYGMETSPNLYVLMGYRGAKLYSDPVLFLGPHTLLGCTILSVWVSILVGMWTQKEATKTMILLSVLLAAHVFPVADGIPGLSINWMACSATIIGAFLAAIAIWKDDELLLDWGWGIMLTMIMGAPALEFLSIFANTWSMIAADGVWPDHGPNPDPKSGHGDYAKCDCAILGIIFMVTICLYNLYRFAVWQFGEDAVNEAIDIIEMTGGVPEPAELLDPEGGYKRTLSPVSERRLSAAAGSSTLVTV